LAPLPASQKQTEADGKHSNIKFVPVLASNAKINNVTTRLTAFIQDNPGER